VNQEGLGVNILERVIEPAEAKAKLPTGKLRGPEHQHDNSATLRVG
jgi:hypothetical protein